MCIRDSYTILLLFPSQLFLFYLFYYHKTNSVFLQYSWKIIIVIYNKFVKFYNCFCCTSLNFTLLLLYYFIPKNLTHLKKRLQGKEETDVMSHWRGKVLLLGQRKLKKINDEEHCKSRNLGCLLQLKTFSLSFSVQFNPECSLLTFSVFKLPVMFHTASPYFCCISDLFKN